MTDEKKIKTTRAKAKGPESDSKTLTAKMAVLESRNDNLEEMNTLICDKIGGLSDTLTRLDDEVSSDLSMLAHGMDDFTEGMADLDAELDRIGEAVRELGRQVVDLRCTALKASCSTDKLHNSLDFNTRELLRRCEFLSDDMAKAVRELGALRERVDGIVATVDELDAVADDMDERISAQKHDMDALKCQLERLVGLVEHSIPEAIGRVEGNLTRIGATQLRVKTLGGEIEALEGEIEVLGGKVDGLYRESTLRFILAGAALGMALVGMLSGLLL